MDSWIMLGTSVVAVFVIIWLLHILLVRLKYEVLKHIMILILMVMPTPSYTAHICMGHGYHFTCVMARQV